MQPRAALTLVALSLAAAVCVALFFAAALEIPDPFGVGRSRAPRRALVD